MRPIYKCRLCGERYSSETHTGTQVAGIHMLEQAAGIVSTVPGAPTSRAVHKCGGDHAGSLGLADFQGWEKEDTDQ